MTKGRYVIAVKDVVIFLVVQNGQLARCQGYSPSKASWRRLRKLANKQMLITWPEHAVWVMPRKQ